MYFPLVYHKYPPVMDLVICFAYNSKTWLKAVFVTIILPIAHHKTGEVNNRVNQNDSSLRNFQPAQDLIFIFHFLSKHQQASVSKGYPRSGLGMIPKRIYTHVT